jgi:signal transduction histidine kinase
MIKISILYKLKFIFIFFTLFLGIFQIPASKQGTYMIHILFYIAFVVIGHVRYKQATQLLISLVEIAITTWLVQQYGMPVVLLLLAPVFSYVPANISRVQQIIVIGIHLFAVNYILWNESYIFIINIVVLLFIAVLTILEYFHKELKGLYQHYDYLKEQHFELNDTKEQIIQFAKQVEDVAQAGERSRISQQLHDQLGHRLIRIKMMAEAALQIMPTQPDKAVDLFQQVRDQLSTGLDEMRSTVRGMRPFSQVNLIQSLRNLLEEVGRESGVQTSLTVEGSPSPLYPSQDLILYRNAQEALTNALKHGQPSEVKVVINYEPEVVVMSVMNDGLIPSQFDDHHLTTLKGLGVSGMKERCQLAGGSLTFNLTPQFTVISTLPIHKKN